MVGVGYTLDHVRGEHFVPGSRHSYHGLSLTLWPARSWRWEAGGER